MILKKVFITLILFTVGCATANISTQDQQVIESELQTFGGPGSGFVTRFLSSEEYEAIILRSEKAEKVLSIVEFVMNSQGSVLEKKQAAEGYFLRGKFGSGFFNMNPAVLSIWIHSDSDQATSILIRGVAREGLINQKTSEKAVKRVASKIVQYLGSTPQSGSSVLASPETTEQGQTAGNAIRFDPDRKLVVKNLEPQKGIDEQTLMALSNVVVNELAGYCSVQSMDALAAVNSLVEEKLKAGCDDTKCIIEVAGAMDIAQVVTGNISKLGNTYMLSLMLIQTKGENLGVIKRASEECQCTEEELIGMSQRVAAKLMQ